MIIGISLLIGAIVYSFNRALTKIINTSCSHGPACPMWGTIDLHTKIGLGVMIFIVLIGLYLIFFGEEKKIITKIKKIKIKDKQKKDTKVDYKDIMNKLTNDEKVIFEKIIEAEGTIFQSDLVEKSNFNKVKVTRILDKLEGKQIIERKRRGMTNVVILKH